MCLEELVCLIAPLGILDSQGLGCGEASPSLGLTDPLRFKKGGNLTQLGSVANASLMAPEKTGRLWSCCQETQVYQGQIRTHLSWEQTQTLESCDLKVLSTPDPLNLQLWKTTWRLQSQEVCELLSVAEFRPAVDFQEPFKSKESWDLSPSLGSWRLERISWACSY